MYKPKIALLLYGQPRFFNYTYSHILQEYTIKNCETHIFAHFWKDIGFGPEDDKTNNYYNIDNLEQLLNNIGTKKYIVEDYTELDKTISHIHKKINIRLKRYKLGQHLSMERCFNLITKYQEQNNIKYDIVIKVRTDILYKFEKENEKYNFYIKPFEHFAPNTKNCIVPPYNCYIIEKSLLTREYALPVGNTLKDVLKKIDYTDIYNYDNVWCAVHSDIYNIADLQTAKIYLQIYFQ